MVKPLVTMFEMYHFMCTSLRQCNWCSSQYELLLKVNRNFTEFPTVLIITCLATL